MAVVLYRKGGTHREKGILCEMGVFSEFRFMHLVESGEWVLDPEELIEKETKPTQVETKLTQVETEEVEQSESLEEESKPNTDRPSEYSDEMIRAAAAKAKIKNWKRKGIKRLRKELGYDD